MFVLVCVIRVHEGPNELQAISSSQNQIWFIKLQSRNMKRTCIIWSAMLCYRGITCQDTLTGKQVMPMINDHIPCVSV